MQRPVSKSLQEYARGITGGLLFSLPLLYTMEVWWAGFNSHPLRLLLYVIATYILLIGYNYFGGLRHDTGWADVLIDSVEELGLGLFISATLLLILGRVTFDMPASEFIGKIVIEAMTVAIGVSVGTAQLGGGEDGDTGTGNEGAPGKTRAGGATHNKIHFGGQVVISLCGATLFAANVAPTEEVVLIASEISSWNLLGLALLSIALGALILFYSDFTGARRLAHTGGILAVIIGTVITYSIALITSAIILWFFGRFDGMSLIICLAETVVLGLAATLGASAGRLLLQTE